MKKFTSIAAALSVSLFIYVFYRSEKTVVNEFIILLLSFDSYLSIKTGIMDALPLPKSIVYSLPGGLWVFCVTLLSQNFYFRIWSHKISLTFVPILFVIGLELCQLAHLTNGRFDFLDLIFYVLFWALAYYFSRANESQQDIVSPFTLDGFICVACFLSVYLAHVSQ